MFLTELVYPQEKHEVQLTLASLIDRTTEDESALVPFSVEYGITNHWQLEGSWSGYTEFRGAPWSHLRSAKFSVGTKYSFMNIAHSPVHVALGFDAEFPVAGAVPGPGDNGIELEPTLAVAVDVKRVTVFASGTASLAPQEVKEIEKGLDDPGTLSGGALVAFRYATIAVEYASRSDSLPWRLDGSPLLTPSLVLHPPHDWELGFGLPTGVRTGFRRPGIAIHVIKEFD